MNIITEKFESSRAKAQETKKSICEGNHDSGLSLVSAKVKDFGADSEKGKRWCVICEFVKVAEVENLEETIKECDQNLENTIKEMDREFEEAMKEYDQYLINSDCAISENINQSLSLKPREILHLAALGRADLSLSNSKHYDQKTVQQMRVHNRKSNQNNIRVYRKLKKLAA